MSVEVKRSAVGRELPQVFGRYLLVDRLSRGGMGEIFLARHGLSGFEKLVVIKKVLPHLAEDEQFISRFIDEAQVAIKLSHANIAQVFEVGRVEREYFLAMEYVEGRDSRRTLSALHERRERLPLDMALFIAREVASGLAYAHRRSDERGDSLDIVHCDISPPNIVLSFEGEIKIIDFGIAKSIMRGTATDPKMGFGKFGYMAPEQLLRGGEVDYRTDIYATGVILYELLTGQRLYAMGETPDYRGLARMVTKGQHPLPSDTDPALAPYDSLVARALRPKPEDRYQSEVEFRDAIQRALVHVNPTMSSDYLGAFIRQLFADEVAEQRRLVAEAEATNLDQWEAQLTTQSATTISYALAHLPLLAPAETELVALSPPLAPEPYAPAAAPRRTQRRAVAIALVAAVLLTGGSVLAWVLGGSADQPTASMNTEPVGAPVVLADTHATHVPRPTVKSLVPAPVLSGDVAVATEDAGARARSSEPSAASGKRAAIPAAAAGKVRPRRKVRPRARATSRPKKPAAKKFAPMDAKRIHAKFRTVSRAYRAFRSSNGSRLEREWSDLATYAQFARSDNKLRVLDRKINRFRARMKSEQN